MKAKAIVYFFVSFLIITAKAQTIEWNWGRGGGGSLNDTGRVVVMDVNRNAVYVLGGTNSPDFTVGNQTLNGPSSESSFFAKYDTSGNLKWVKRVTGYLHGLACDSISGAIYVTGGAGVSKYDSSGVLKWTVNATFGTQLGGSSIWANDVTVLSDGSIILAGIYLHTHDVQDTLVIGNFRLANNGSRFLARITSAGVVINATLAPGYSMSTELTGSDLRKVYKIEKDNNDNIYLQWNRLGRQIQSDGACPGLTIPVNAPYAFNSYKVGSWNKFDPSLVFRSYGCTPGPPGSVGSCNSFYADREIRDMARDVNGDIYYSVYYRDYFGSNNCSGGGYFLFRISSNPIPNPFPYITNSPPADKITVHNGLVQCFYGNTVTLYDYQTRQVISTTTIPITVFDAYQIPGTRKTIVTGLYTGNTSVGPDQLPTLPGNNFVIASETISCPTSLTITPASATICSNDSVILSATSGLNYLWNTGETTKNIKVSTAGIYSVQSIIPGCPTLTSNSVTITVNPSPPVPNITASGPLVFCLGDSVTLTAPPGYTYNWNGETTQSIVQKTTANRAVLITNNFGCTAVSNSVTVYALTNTNPIFISISGPTTFCGGDSVILTAPSGFNYLWSNGQTTRSITVTTSGNYSVFLSNSLSCFPGQNSNTISVNVIPNPVPIITPAGTINICGNNSVTLTSSPASSYVWSNGYGGQSIVVNSPGTYYVEVPTSSSYSCRARSLPVIVTTNIFPPVPVISANGPTTFCQGGSVILTAPAGYSYVWSNGATTQSITVNTAGNYTVTVSNGIGCSATSIPTSVNVINYPTGNIVVSGTTTFCTSGVPPILTFTGPSFPGQTYLWNNGVTAHMIIPLTTGTYSITVNNNGCTASFGPVQVTRNPTPPVPIIAASGPTSFCQGGSVTLTAPSGYTYLWSNGITTQSIMVTATGNYTVTVTDGNGCSNISLPTPVTVNSLPLLPVITLSSSPVFCQGGSVNLTAPAGFTYLWNNGATTQSINVSTTGNYSVTITNANGCSSTSAQMSITVNPLPAVPTITASGPTTFCQGGSVTLSAPAGYTYLWNNGANTQNINVTTSGNYSVTATNANLCSASSAATTVTVNPLPPIPVVTASGPTSFCQGGSVTLTAPPGYTYLWSNGATSQSINATSSGNYSVTVTANGCSSASAATTVTVYPLPAVPIVTASGPTTFCQGGTVTLTAPSGFMYLWSNGATTQSINVLISGNYSVTVTNGNGCTNTSVPTTVTVNPLPPVPVITQSGNTLTTNAATTYQWYFNGTLIAGATSQSYVYSTGGDYTVTVTNAQGCSSTSQSYTAMRNEFVLLNGNERFYMNLFPNPVTEGQLTIVYEIEQPHQVGIRLINMQGRSISIQQAIPRSAGRYTVNANAVAERIWTGVYILEFTIDGKKVTRTIIKL